MNHSLMLGPYSLQGRAEQCTPHTAGYLLHGQQVALELPFSAGSYYRHGFQSWSLATWQAPGEVVPVPRPHRLHSLQTDPRYVRDPRPNGSWLGAVEAPDGQVLLLGALDLDTHVALDGQRLLGWNPSCAVEWFVTLAPEAEAFARYAGMLGDRFGRAAAPCPPRVWCSWYSLHSVIDESILDRQLGALRGLPFEVFQVDDGWQRALGDWEPNERFPAGMAALAGRIRQAGFIPGLWLAPLLVVPSSQLYRQHPEWLLRDPDGQLVSAGFLKLEPLFTLDSAHPEVLAWLAARMQAVRGWGFDFLKLDFLYAGALPGAHHGGLSGELAYRGMLSVVRQALGEAYLLACGAPILPSLGLCDGLRIGPDVADNWVSDLEARVLSNFATPGTQNALRTTLHRLWLAPVVNIDPDVAYFQERYCRLDPAQRRLLQDLALICRCKATSDLPGWLSAAQQAELLAFLEGEPRLERLGRYQFALDGRVVDFSPAVPLPPPTGLSGAGLRWLSELAWVLRLNNQLALRQHFRLRQAEG